MKNQQIIKIYVSDTDQITEDIQTIEKFVSEHDERMMIYRPEDELEQISNRVQKLADALKAYKESGINWRVFNRYLRGHGIAQRDIDSVLNGVESFLQDMGIENN